jgi:VWFA-related protein
MKFLAPLTLLFICVFTVAAQEKPAGKTSPSTTTAIVVDCSGSLRLQLDKTITTVKQIAESMRPGDEAFLIKFVDAANIKVMQDLTDQKAEVADAAEDLYTEGGQTAIMDAVDFAAKHFSENKGATGGRSRIIVLITDGDEPKNSGKLDETIALLKQEHIRVYAIGLSDIKVSTKLLDRLSKDTGGKMFIPRTTAELSNAVLDISAASRGESAKK